MYRSFLCVLLLIISHGYGLYLDHGFDHDFGPDHFGHGCGHDHHHGFGHDFGPDHSNDSGDDSSDDSGDDSSDDSGDMSGDDDDSRSHEHDHKNCGDGIHHQQSDFEKLAQHLAAANKILRNTCNQSSNIKTRVFIGMDFYALKYSLQGFSEDSIAVKVKNNVVSVTATHLSLGNFKDLRILPHFVKVSDATWYFEEGVLRILFPYKIPPKTEVVLLCDEADDIVINIPKQNVSQIDPRFLGPL